MGKVMPVASSALRHKRLIWVSRRRCAKGRAQAEASLLRVALRKLLSNTDRHAPQAQAIRVQDATLDDGRVHIVVSNAGELLPADEIPRLHQKYCRGHIAQHKPGAGLGLYWVQRIAVYPRAGAGVNRAGRSEMPEQYVARPVLIDCSTCPHAIHRLFTRFSTGLSTAAYGKAAMKSSYPNLYPDYPALVRRLTHRLIHNRGVNAAAALAASYKSKEKGVRGACQVRGRNLPTAYARACTQDYSLLVQRLTHIVIHKKRQAARPACVQK